MTKELGGRIQRDFDDISMVANPDKRAANYKRILARISAMKEYTRDYLLTLLAGSDELTDNKAKLVQAIADHAADLPVYKAYDLLRLLRDISRYKYFYTKPECHSLFERYIFSESYQALKEL